MNTPDKPNPDASNAEACDACEPHQNRPGPAREGGGTTGAGNLTGNQANRTGGLTDDVDNDAPAVAPPRRGVIPDA